MAYYRPGDRVGGYPMGPELGPDGLDEIGALDRGFRPGGADYGYDVPSYGRRPLGEDYVGGPADYYGAERPGRYRQGYGPSVYDEGLGPSVYDEGYLPPRQPPMLAEPSDLGMGLRDTGMVSGRADYGAGYGRPDFASRYGGAPGYGGGAMSAEDEVRRLRKELEHERREKHELELAAGGALGYGLYERHEKKEAKEDDGSSSSDDDDGKKESKLHRLFHRH